MENVGSSTLDSGKYADKNMSERKLDEVKNIIETTTVDVLNPESLDNLGQESAVPLVILITKINFKMFQIEGYCLCTKWK